MQIKENNNQDYIDNAPTMTTEFNLNVVHPSWHEEIKAALKTINSDYLTTLKNNPDWLPGADKIFSAFSLPVDKVKYVLFGESPYPRKQSANGYAFWDANVSDLWSSTGLSKQVNRATSLRNIMKMLLVTENLLSPDNTTQESIAQLNKNQLIQTNTELFNSLTSHGFLLLNATPVLQINNVKNDAKAWRPFIKSILTYLIKKNPHIEFLLLGNIANEIDPLITEPNAKKLYAEHPYNISFINNPDIQNFFRPLHLLIK
jgi:uracil-DNA glycosylase